MVRTKQTGRKETDEQAAICDYLAARGYFFWRQNTIPPTYLKDGQRQFRRMPKHSLNGVPDIILVKDGTFWGLEVKSAIGKQSDNQREFERRCSIAGGRYELVRRLEDVLALGL